MIRRNGKWFGFLAAALAFFAAAGAQEPAQVRGRGMLRQLESSLVDVHYHLRYNDRGEAPQSIGVYCAGCRTFHDSDLGALLAERRDLVLNGFLVTPDTVLAPDVMLAPDGYDAITVRFGKAETKAQLEAYYPEYGAVRLRLAKPLAGTKVLQFDGDRTKKLYTFQRVMEDGKWMTQTVPFSADSSIYMPEIDRASAAAPGNTLLIDGDGKPAALLMNNNELTENMSLFGSWTKWPEVKAEVWNEQLAKLEQVAIQVVYHHQTRKMMRASYTIKQVLKESKGETLQKTFCFYKKLPWLLLKQRVSEDWLNKTWHHSPLTFAETR